MSASPSDDEVTLKKPEKKEKKSKKRPVESDSSSDEVEDKTPLKKGKSNDNRVLNSDGNEMIALGSMRYLTARSFKGKALVDIREFYLDKNDGKLKPGKKGISLSKEQYENLKKVIPEVDEQLKAL